MGSDEGEQNKVWEKIIQVAQADGRITREESNLIVTILENAKNYDVFLNQALEDDEIDEQEKIELINLRATILDKAYREASDDKKISDDEYAIIEETLKILHKLEVEEFKHDQKSK